ncbi:MAG TPA: DNA polymerase Y family protein [Burkholderiales bacterium]|nr:DNA polymerase Y family protein [Burkholderiales bacterium]
MLWLALRFASLPLEVFTRAARGSTPLAVSDAHAGIIACNPAARAIGVGPGMPLAAAFALAGELNVVPRDSAAEEAALKRIAAWAIQFTPAVSIAGPCEVLLEIAGSLGIFGGLNALWNEIERGLRGLGFTASMACAPTPLAAQWFARAGLAVRLRHADALRSSLPDLPLAVMQPEPEALALLKNIGARTVSDCLALPRDGLARRLGPHLIDDLDRALGTSPDPRGFFTPPTTFTAAQPLPAPAQEAEMLLFAARRLLIELCGFLAATANGVQRLTFTFNHHAHAPTHIALSLVAATRDADHLTNVLREKLERTTLPCPATALALQSELTLPLASRNLTFLPEAREQEEAAAQLIERLRARLGDDAVAGLQRCADHRPERAWAKCEPGAGDRVTACIAGRPLWLLPQPRALTEIGEAPCYDGRLTLLAGPERIESGWWDGDDVMRDYFVAASPAEALLWIYRERSAGAGWFLHGFFA